MPVEHLAEFVGAVEEMVAAHGTTAAYYAHASAGCLHIRPLVNLKDASTASRSMKEMADAAAELAHRFGGVMSGEHGDGLQRSELNEVIFGPELYQAMREFKRIFDPRGLMNPGKKVDAPSMTENLRYGPDLPADRDQDHLDFTARAASSRAVEMCNGAAVCRKLKAGTMCPSYMATRDEKDTTRGRANALRNALAGRHLRPSDFTSKDDLRGDGSLPLLQGVQDRVPVQRRHGQDQDGVPGPLPRGARHAAARHASSATSTRSRRLTSPVAPLANSRCARRSARR